MEANVILSVLLIDTIVPQHSNRVAAEWLQKKKKKVRINVVISEPWMC